MSRLPNNSDDMSAVIQSAIDLHPPPESGPADDELLAMLAAGQGPDLAAADRDRLLRLIAADPVLAQLVAEIWRPGLIGARRRREKAAAKRTAASAKQKAAGGEDRIERGAYRIESFVRRIWFSAATLMFGLGSWRMMSPVQAIMEVPYWLSRLGIGVRGLSILYEIREWGFITSMAGALILSIPVAYWEFTGKNRPSS